MRRSFKPGFRSDRSTTGVFARASVREALYLAGHVILTKPVKVCSGLRRLAPIPAHPRDRPDFDHAAAIRPTVSPPSEHRCRPRLRVRRARQQRALAQGAWRQSADPKTPFANRPRTRDS
jgi:hypothetical protein